MVQAKDREEPRRLHPFLSDFYLRIYKIAYPLRIIDFEVDDSLAIGYWRKD